MPEYQYLTYESLDDGTIVRIMLDRPESKNAQHRGLLVELDEAMRRAEADDEVRVVILGGHGTMFSSGHDMGTDDRKRLQEPGPSQHASFRSHGGTRERVESVLLQEWHFYFQNTLRWRNLRKKQRCE